MRPDLLNSLESHDLLSALESLSEREVRLSLKAVQADRDRLEAREAALQHLLNLIATVRSTTSDTEQPQAEVERALESAGEPETVGGPFNRGALPRVEAQAPAAPEDDSPAEIRRRRIIDILSTAADRVWTPREIGQALQAQGDHTSPSNVRTTLQRMVSKDDLVRVQQGFYCLAPRHLSAVHAHRLVPNGSIPKSTGLQETPLAMVHHSQGEPPRDWR
jgi:hypothetical protein